MQSIFRLPALPWSPGALDKATIFHQPIVDMGAANKGKRKRATDGSSPRASPKLLSKKIKSVESVSGGAVQSMPEQQVRREADGLPPTVAPAPVAPGISSPGESQTAAISKELMGSGVHVAPAVAPLPVTPVLQVSVKPMVNGTLTSMNGGMPALLGRSQQDMPALASLPISAAQTMVAQPIKPASSVPAPLVQLKVATQHNMGITPSRPEDCKPQSTTSPKPVMKIDNDILRAVIEAEINQAIIFKHNELRLVDQEIAKCQVALEQIRRCNLIPFPGLQAPSLALSSHSGPALAPPTGYSVPDSPAPWGVTDGPYSRHYATWLIPSPRFDAQSPEAIAASALNSPFPNRDGRVTRGSGLDVATPLSSVPGRPSRSIAGRIRSSHDPASPLAGRDPLIIKRQKDGQWVKLYCSNCNPERSDFANVQGFLNHCRISHKLDFKSHEAAAIECGRVVEANEYFPPMEPQSAREPLPRPTFSTSFTFAVDKLSVHPLNKIQTKVRDVNPVQQILPRSYSMGAVTQRASPMTPAVSPGFIPSPDTPYLSSLLGKRGFGNSLATMVQDAKRKVDLSEYDVESDPDVDMEAKPTKGKKKNPNSTTGHFKSKSAARPLSSTAAHQRLAPAPIQMRPAAFSSFTIGTASPASSTDVDMELSPHTADSNPGLVSDREDSADEDEHELEAGSVRKDSGDEVLVAIEDSDGEGRCVVEDRGFCGAHQRA
jgi:ADA HAT complex component 1